MLGKALAEEGYKVRVSLVAVENRNVGCSLKRTVERHTRWAKLRRAIHPFPFAFEPIMSPIVTTTMACAVLSTRSLAMAFLVAVLLQTLGAVITTRVLRGTPPRWYWVPLEIVRAYLWFFCWLMACASRRVSWRGHDFELARDSAIVPAEPSVWNRVRALVRA
jgi:ceramide glucosyltransferase